MRGVRAGVQVRSRLGRDMLKLAGRFRERIFVFEGEFQQLLRMLRRCY